MIEIRQENYQALMQNPVFTCNHQPQFIKTLGDVYRNNIHLSPFLTDIKAFADDLEAPEIVIIQRGGNLTISANASCDTYDEALYEFITSRFNEGNEMLWLHVLTNNLINKINTLCGTFNLESMNRYNFRLNTELFSKLSNWRNQIPDGFSVEYFDTQSVDFRKKHGKTDEAFFPESKRFAFVILYNDKIISECFSVIVDNNIVEIGIHTYDDNFRRKGLAFITSAAFIEHCIKNNFVTNWGCDYNNVASISLAKKLGYELLNEEIGIRITKK